MDDIRRKLGEALFQAALDLPPDERARFLDNRCQDDPNLRADLERLLRLDEAAMGDFLCSPLCGSGASASNQPSAAETLNGRRIGSYAIGRLIGSGGMGAVFEAVQEHPSRLVALKLMKGGMTSPSAMRRFAYESEILGRLRHPGIAQVYEAGTHKDFEGSFGPSGGQVPYFAMEYVPGARMLTEYVRQSNLNLREKIELFIRVCDAVHHGHDQGVIHRDLKPGNILIDAAGAPKIIDFGVARCTDSDIAVTTLATEAGQLVGTLAYMSPEQLGGEGCDLDRRTDVYSLGVILHELLAGRLPLEVHNRSIPDAARVIREGVPSSLGTVDRALRGDIETIVSKTIEKDRDVRYASAADLAADLRRFLADEPIVARPASAFYQLRKLAKRNKGVVTVATIALVLLVAALIVAVNQAVEQSRLRRLAQRAEYRARIAAAAGALSVGDGVAAHGHLEGVPAEYHLIWEFQHLRLQVDVSRAVLRGHTKGVTSLAFLEAGKTLVSGGLDGTVRFWSASSGLNGREPIQFPAGIRCLAVSQDGARLVAGCVDGHAYVTDWVGGARISLPCGTGPVTCAAFDPGGARIATGSMDEQLQLWDAATGRLIWTEPWENPIYSVAFIRGGTRLLVAGAGGMVSICDPEIGRCEHWKNVHPHVVNSAALSPDCDTVATASADRTVTLRNAASGKRLHVLEGHSGEIKSVCFSPDGETIASAGVDRTIRLWSVREGQAMATLHGHTGAIERVAFSPDGLTLVSASLDGTVRQWDRQPPEAVTVLRGHGNYIYPVAYSASGAVLASGSWDKSVRLWDPRNGDKLAALTGHEGVVASLAFAGDRMLASGSYDHTIRLWDVQNRNEIACLKGHDHYVNGLAFSPDGRHLASASEDRTVRLWEILSGRELTVLRDHSGEVVCVAFSPLGSRFATGSLDQTVRIHEISGNGEVQAGAVLRGHTETIRAVAFSPDDQQLASAGDDETIRLWNPHTGAALNTLRGHRGRVYGLAFNPDGSRLASAGEDQTIRLWDASAGELVCELHGHTSYVFSVAFSPDGRQLASGAGDSTVRLWHTTTHYRH